MKTFFKISSYFYRLTFVVVLTPLMGWSENYRTESVTTFTYHSKQSMGDKRFEYDHELLKLSLEKTKKKHGPYKLIPLAVNANYKRIEILAQNKQIKNLFFKQSVSTKRLNTLGYVPFPVDRGIVGYRVALVSEQNKEKLKLVKTVQDLKKFTVLQGFGWLDVKILEHNGFKVMQGGSYEGLFEMVSRNRGDLFIRGANELYQEWVDNKHLENLTYDETFVLYYPLPRFFFTHKTNKKAIKRVQEGLILAYNDGSLINLWEKHYLKSIEFVNFNKRKIFKIENPLLKGLDGRYKKYIYTP